jgi:spore germination cell wall hydrolase CwlJ-like protein
MKKFILLTLAFTMYMVSSLNSTVTNQYWVPSIYKGEGEFEHPKIQEALLDPTQLECMAKNIYFEAAIESTAGKLAVAQVTLNRVNSDRFPSTICGVVKQGRHYPNGFPVRDRCQFSWYCDGKHDEPFQGKMWKESTELARYVMKHPNLKDITDGSTHYHADYIPDPRWANPKERTVKIDTHIFYKKVKF